MLELINLSAHQLTTLFAALFGLSIFIYAILDGYDLGIGILSCFVEEEERDLMVASIGPFWDANETWMVLAIGLLLVAFPKAQGILFSSIYLSIFFMLIGLIARGVCIDLRSKVTPRYKKICDMGLFWGSFLAATSQGYMLGKIITCLDHVHLYAFLPSLVALSSYVLLGTSWLIIKTQGALQKKAITWAQRAIPMVALFFMACFLWIPTPNIVKLWNTTASPLNVMTLLFLMYALLMGQWMILKRMPFKKDRFNFTPLTVNILFFLLSFYTLIVGNFPYIIPEKMTIYEASASRESLAIILPGALIFLPSILAINLFTHKTFAGKAEKLDYT